MNRHALVLSVALAALFGVRARAQNPVITIDATARYGAVAHAAVGANHLWLDAGCDTMDTNTLALKPGFVAAMQQMGLGSFRWPCGTRANLFRWQRAIGPLASRSNNPLGDDDGGYGNQMSYFGPDECGRLMEAANMDVTILINFATGSPDEAADLVEYMNAPVGTNPRGGIAWADVRATNGHPKPYGVKYFEIGNEYNLSGQNYWLDPLWGNRSAYADAYCFGGSTAWVTNGVVTATDFSTNGMLGNGKAGQVKYARFPPVDPGQPFALAVDGTNWTCVTNLSLYAATSQVYTLDFPTGTIQFGDGTHGAKPASKAEIRLSYTSGPHGGFVDFVREMKAADPTIKVYSPLDWPEFCSRMGTNYPYDGLVQHFYPSYQTAITVSNSEAALYHRVTSPAAYFYTNTLENYRYMASASGPLAAKMDVAMTEFGLMPLDVTNPDPGETLDGHPLRDALWYALMKQYAVAYGLPLCMKHVLLGKLAGFNDFIFHNGPDNFVLGATAHTAGQVARLKDKNLLACWTANNPIVASYPKFINCPALQVTAAQDTNDALWVLVVNVDRYNDYPTTIKPLGLVNAGTATAWTVTAQNDWSNNWTNHPNDVTTTSNQVAVSSGVVTYTFPKHSVTVLQLPKAVINGAWQTVRSYGFTNAGVITNAWYPATGEWYLAGKAQVLSLASVDGSTGYALRLPGADPSHGRATLTLGPTWTNGQIRLSADIWSANTRSNPLYISFGDYNRTSAVAVAFAQAHDGLVNYADGNNAWQSLQAPFYQDTWQRLTVVFDLDAKKYDVLLNGRRLFPGGEGRDKSTACTNPIAKLTFETSTTATDNGIFYVSNVLVETFVTNTSPTVAPVADRSLIAGQTLVITNAATDASVPAQTLAWSLASLQTNATLNPTNGLFAWRPLISQAPTQALFQVIVTDNGFPPLSATQSFKVTVAAPARPRLTAPALTNRQFNFSFTGDVGPDYNIYASTNLRQWNLLLSTNPAALPTQVPVAATNFSRRFFRVLLGP